jgi:hypothetical protein
MVFEKGEALGSETEARQLRTGALIVVACEHVGPERALRRGEQFSFFTKSRIYRLKCLSTQTPRPPRGANQPSSLAFSLAAFSARDANCRVVMGAFSSS